MSCGKNSTLTGLPSWICFISSSLANFERSRLKARSRIVPLLQKKFPSFTLQRSLLHAPIHVCEDKPYKFPFSRVLLWISLGSLSHSLFMPRHQALFSTVFLCFCLKILLLMSCFIVFTYYNWWNQFSSISWTFDEGWLCGCNIIRGWKWWTS